MGSDPGAAQSPKQQYRVSDAPGTPELQCVLAKLPPGVWLRVPGDEIGSAYPADYGDKVAFVDAYKDIGNGYSLLIAHRLDQTEDGYALDADGQIFHTDAATGFVVTHSGFRDRTEPLSASLHGVDFQATLRNVRDGVTCPTSGHFGTAGPIRCFADGLRGLIELYEKGPSHWRQSPHRKKLERARSRAMTQRARPNVPAARNQGSR